MLMTPIILSVIKTLVFSSILFVWVIRYQNIVEEFKQFSYPNWLRDLVGILKITSAVLIMSPEIYLVKFGALSISLLMMAAFVTHLRIQNPVAKMLPSLTLLVLNLLIFFMT
jgi:uncharacterized membrane protein